MAANAAMPMLFPFGFNPMAMPSGMPSPEVAAAGAVLPKVEEAGGAAAGGGEAKSPSPSSAAAAQQAMGQMMPVMWSG